MLAGEPRVEHGHDTQLRSSTIFNVMVRHDTTGQRLVFMQQNGEAESLPVRLAADLGEY